MGKIISIINQKGGVGKTTSSSSISVALANMGYRTLVFDLDPQCNLTASLGATSQESNTYSVLKGNCKFKPISIIPNLDLLPSSIDLSAFDLEMSGEPGKEYLLKELIESVIANYDYVLLDCSPNLGLIALNALTASKFYIIPLLPHYLSVQGLSKLLEITDKIKKRLNPKLELGGVIITQYNSRKILHQDTVEVIKKHFKEKLFTTFIRENISLAEAPGTGLDIFRYAPSSNGAIDYLSLAKEIIKL
jgi:chromosome partitioning protein